jgi:hypothetical protein
MKPDELFFSLKFHGSRFSGKVWKKKRAEADFAGVFLNKKRSEGHPADDLFRISCQLRLLSLFCRISGRIMRFLYKACTFDHEISQELSGCLMLVQVYRYKQRTGSARYDAQREYLYACFSARMCAIADYCSADQGGCVKGFRLIRDIRFIDAYLP